MDSGWQRNVLENGDKEDTFGDGDELRVGTVVENENEAYELYNTYAFKKGFSIRKGKVRRDAQNKLRQRDYFCSKEGFPLDEEVGEAKKVRRLDTRTGCKAMVRFNVEDGKWRIVQFNPVHNHEFAKPEERQFLRSSRHISTVRAAIIGYNSSKVDASVRPTKTLSYLEKEMSSTDNAGFGFTEKGVHDCLHRLKENMIGGADGQSLLDYLKHQQLEDSSFFYSVKVDQYNRVTNFFWRDSRSRLDYDCFGDVVLFDTTFRTKKYNLVCAPFVGVDHHWKNVLFGCAFLLDESTDSFTWLFENFLESMGDKRPKTIFTDEDNAMAKAIEVILPGTHHRLCTWNISKNASQYLASHLANPEFKECFNKCFHECVAEAEFEATWDDMVKKFNLENDLWLKKLYLLRQKWSPAFSPDTFTANIGCDQRGENIDTTFHQISTTTMDLIGLAQHYEKKTKVLRLAQAEEDFRCKNGMPRLRVNTGIFKHAAAEYTIKLYSFFENEILSTFGVRMMEVGNDGYQYVYEAVEEGHQRVYIIQYNSTTSTICCSCKLFESMGVLCRHALKVLDLKNITSIPAQYIVKRWTRGAKNQNVMSSGLCEPSCERANSAQSLRLSELMQEGNNVFSIGSLCDSGTRIVKQKLVEAIKLLETDKETTSMLGTSNK
ncbi:PREDICTED: protein FAR1-RELATED SEQUENCE 5-like isoform X1 [Fragaria vesca subsp. vesca]|uniref:protein FAR1-RELATED SEQUENCE 5-like isoform X1 n=1 Tax=Fragaria vesca subsp. vesca TaxID=101020 RepID=UPI0002C2E5E7|nr:PREDICTED: protein FAR1-RELATED SEQUENCE 5-like isoform X1 [Fragaria vesca subsp. vesca]